MQMQSQVLGLGIGRQSAQGALQSIHPGSIYALQNANAAQNTITLQGTPHIQSDTLTLGGETLDKTLIQQLKSLVGGTK